MAEIHDQLRADLAELRRQLETTPNLDAASRNLIERVTTDVERLLASENSSVTVNTNVAVSHRGSLAGRLAQATKQFEATHPTLAGTIGSIADALAQMGI